MPLNFSVNYKKVDMFTKQTRIYTVFKLEGVIAPDYHTGYVGLLVTSRTRVTTHHVTY